MKRCSILLVTGKYKITMRKHYTSMWNGKTHTKSKIFKLQYQVLVRTQSNWNSHALLVEIQTDTASWKTVFWVKQFQIKLTYNPTIPFLGIYFREMNVNIHTKLYTQMFIAASYISTQIIQHKGPSTGKWINKLWYIQFNGMKAKGFVSRSVMSHSAIPRTVAHQAPLAEGFSRQEY